MLNAKDHNILIQVGENQDIKEFYAHSNILRSYSRYFKNIIPAGIKKDVVLVINKPNITPVIFEILLKYIYEGEFDLKKQSEMDNFNLLIACDYLHLEDLFEYIQCYIIKRQIPWTQENFALVLNYIFNLPNFKKLQEHCIKFIYNNYPRLVFNSSHFSSLDKHILFYLLKQDDFRVNIEEVTVWDTLIEWGIKQTPELENNNQNEWTEKNYEDLKNTLSDFIPLIKFINITSEDFYDKVRPYEAIIPNNIYNETMEYYLVGKPKLCIYKSKIIKSDFINVIANFIDKKVSADSTTMYIRTADDPIYKFELIYSSNFHNSFGNIKHESVVAASLIIIKTQESDKIFVGYSSVGFDSNEDDIINIYNSNYFRSETFILSFKDSEEIKGMRLSYAIFSCCTGFTKKYTSWDSECDALCIMDQKLYIKNIEGCMYSWKHFENVSSWRNYYKSRLTLTNIYTIKEIEAFCVVKSSDNYVKSGMYKMG
ncbi:hypothetical protein RclHR1_14090004 [Rhizophagus clarus]|uniref:BTB domain-containing protein n=1 Tax=Rhizophagus clarus TaxID=94130 RepID=A0A2Z6QG59_9GLOM|nr:hypothetical protein RclHR1_14090004 [Rhizophagus clarus]GES81659.1 hypothetical protein GLOIN_2v1847655 [Rhizophagus clarus]